MVDMSQTEHRHPKYIPSLLKLKCPHCRQGNMFTQKHSFSKKFMQMNEPCAVCGQPTEIEPSFYYGTGYVSYSLAVAISVSTFVAWWVLIGFSFHDSRFFWWIGLNALLLLVMQPYLMRLSRTIWLSFFVKYDKNCAEIQDNSTLEQENRRA
jgi:uncharacterized protein (DUF983 family)